MTVFNLISLAGGLALFLYGMNLMGSGLEKLAGGKTEAVLQKLTSSTLKGVLLGAVITALIQSSSGTTVIVIGLVNSGILQFSQAIGVIMGANIGTTITGQLIRLSDISGDNILLKILQPSTLAPAIAFAGAILYVFFKSAKKRNAGQTMLGFGILFAGMFAMEAAVLPLRESPLFLQAFASLKNPVLGVLVGALITAVLQSSSASVGILQALTATGAVTWGSAVPIILGQNIGTCATGLIASAGASRSAKRVAVVHLYFNIIGSLVALVGIYAFKGLVGIPFWDAAMNRGAIADFHTIFNIVATLVFLPFTKQLARLTEWTVPDRGGEDHPELTATVLDERLYASPSVAIAQAHKAVEQMAVVARLNQESSVPLLLEYSTEKIQLAEQREDVIDKLDATVSKYLVNMKDLDLGEHDNREVTLLLNFVTEFERIGDYAINVVQRAGEVFDKEIVFSGNARRELHLLHAAVGEILDITIQAFSHGDLMEAGRVEPLEETVDRICETLRDRHIDRLKAGSCTIDAGIVFLEVLNDYERIADHCSNVAARLILANLDAESFDMHELRRQLHEGGTPQYDELAAHYKEKYLDPLEDITGGGPLPAARQPVRGWR